MRVPLVNCRDSVLAHRARDTVWFLEQVLPQIKQYLWHRPIPCLPVLCVGNVNELKQHMIDVWYSIEQRIIELLHITR